MDIFDIFKFNKKTLEYIYVKDDIQLFKKKLEQIKLDIKEVEDIFINTTIYKNPKYLKLLLETNIDLNIKNKYGSTVLMTASIYGYTDSVRLLLEAGANPNIKNKEGKTALILVSEKLENININCMELLLEFKADVNLQDCKGNTALLYASKNNNTKCIKLLITYNANPNILNYEEIVIEKSNSYIFEDQKIIIRPHTCLKYLINNKNEECVLLLMKIGAKL